MGPRWNDIVAPTFQKASGRGESTLSASPVVFVCFSCRGTAGNIAAAARRVARRRRVRACQSMSMTKATTNASAPRTPPTIAGIRLELCPCEESCDEDSPGTTVCVVVGVAAAVSFPGWPEFTSAESVRRRHEYLVLNGVKLRGDGVRGDVKDDETYRQLEMLGPDPMCLLSSVKKISWTSPHFKGANADLR